MEVLNKKWVAIKLHNSDICWIELEDDGDIVHDTPDVLEHIVSLHNKHIDDIMALKMMRDKLCDTEDSVC